MFYFRPTPNRVFFLNEYWVFIPIGLVANYVLIQKIRSSKKKVELFKKLEAQLEHERKIRRILYLSLALNGCGSSYLAYLLTRGGGDANFIDASYILDECNIEEGVRFLDEDRLRRIVLFFYRHKLKGKIIFITATALCHVSNQYGQKFLAFPFAIGDFGLTSVYQAVRKGLATLLIGAVGPLFVMGGTVPILGAIFVGTMGVRFAIGNWDLIATSPVPEKISAKELEPRIPNSPDVVVVNSRNKLTMSGRVTPKPECWLPDQTIANPSCQIKPTEVPSTIELAGHDLHYDEVVNMQDVTGLTKVQFSDKQDLGQEVKTAISKASKGKTVNFLDKFGDSGPIDPKDTWDIGESKVPERIDLRTEN